MTVPVMLRACVPAMLLLLALGGVFLGFSGSVDDAHITFWAAHTLGSEGKILNYNAEPVEQSSALLQTVLLGVLHALTGVSVVTLGHVTTMIAGLATIYVVVIFARRWQWSLAGVALLLASSPFFVYWTFGGMESPLLALLLLLWLLQVDRWLRDNSDLFLPGLFPLGLLSLAVQMSRPEMPLVLCAVTFAALLLKTFPARCSLSLQDWRVLRILVLLLLQVLAAGLLTAWRWWYFGDVMPQPVSAKVAGSLWYSLQHGWQYLQSTMLDIYLLPMTLLACAGVMLVLWRTREPLAVLVVLLCLVYGGFVVASGGDWMAAGRFWVPVMPLLALLAVAGLQAVCQPPAIRHAVLAGIVLLHGAYLWRGTGVDFNGVPLWKTSKLEAADRADTFSFFERHAREHLHDIPTVGFARTLVRTLLSQPDSGTLHIMAGQMGMVPFYLSQEFGHRLRFVDRNGITERTLTHCAATRQLLRTRNGIGTGYEWILQNRQLLEQECGFVMPDIVFDIETGWNRHNITALQRAGYVFVYRQRGHIVEEAPGEWLPLRKIGAGQFIAVSQPVWQALGQPAPVERVF